MELHKSLLKLIPSYLGGIAGLVLDHYNKANIEQSEWKKFFGFPLHIKVMLTLYCSLLNLALYLKDCIFLNYKCIINKNA